VFQSDVVGVQRWVVVVVSALRVLIAQAKEETVLSRLQELALSVCVYKHTLDKHRKHRTDDAPAKAQSPLGVPAEEVLAR
jgi:uncharacterized membrane protein